MGGWSKTTVARFCSPPLCVSHRHQGFCKSVTFLDAGSLAAGLALRSDSRRIALTHGRACGVSGADPADDEAFVCELGDGLIEQVGSL